MVVAVDAFKIAYMAIPKAACTSIKAALASIDPAVPDGAELFEANPLAIHKIYPSRRFRADRWRSYDDWYRFVVVRDPVKRLLSLYTDIVAGRRELPTAANFKRGKAPLPAEPDPDFFFLNLAEYMKWSSVVKHHALRQLAFTGPDLTQFDRVYQTSEMDALAADLSRVAGVEVTIPRMNKSHKALAFDDLTDETKAAIRDRLEMEYDLLGDLFKPPW